MQSYLLYIAKTSLATAIFFLAYRVLFQHQKQFIFNRIYLLFSLLISFIIPLLKFTSTQIIERNLPTISTTATEIYSTNVQLMANSSYSISWLHLLIGAYLLGCIFFLLIFISGNYKALKIIRSCKKIERNDTHIYITSKDVHPFSFFNSIIVSDKTMEHPHLDLILDHEKIHVTEKHTLDIVFAELLFIVQWFNPFIWLMKEAIKNNLEYKTDHVLMKKYDEVHYQLTLVGLAHKRGIAPFLTALNGSQLKNRIIMMKKNTKNKYAMLKQLLILPIVTLLVIGLSAKEVKTEVVYAPAALQESSTSENLNQVQTAIPVEDIQGETAQSEDLHVTTNNETTKEVELKASESIQQIETVDSSMPELTESLPVKKEQSGPEMKTSPQPQVERVIVRGTVISGQSNKPISEAMVVFSVNGRYVVGVTTDNIGKYSIKVNKEKGEFLVKCKGYIDKKIAWDGESEAETEMNIVLEKDQNSDIPDKGEADANWRQLVKDNGIPEYEKGKEPIVLIDGVETFALINHMIYDANTIKSIKFSLTTKVKNIKQTDRIANGFIEIKTNVPERKKVKKVLHVIDQEEIFLRPTEARMYIYPREANSITILNSEEAIKKYGKKGKNGAYILTTKDPKQ